MYYTNIKQSTVLEETKRKNGNPYIMPFDKKNTAGKKNWIVIIICIAVGQSDEKIP